VGAYGRAMCRRDARHALGEAGERLAAAHLERMGMQILARRHRTRFGELDLVAWDRDRTLVFAEVKTRRGTRRTPFEALGGAKRAQVRRMAAAWLNEVAERPHAPELRFDAIGVTVDAGGRLAALDHLEDAF
jgi:putative endonuclease